MTENPAPTLSDPTTSVEHVRAALERHAYIGSSRIATVVHLAMQLQKPVLVEGPPGVGKTELARTTAAMLDLPLIRLQCHEGLDEAKALYEWKYGKQRLHPDAPGAARRRPRRRPASPSRLSVCTATTTSSFRRRSSNRGRCCRRCASPTAACC